MESRVLRWVVISMNLFYMNAGLPSTCGSCFKPPTSISGRTVLGAQTSQSQEMFEHEVHGIPVKVDVQVTPETDLQSVFPGVGSAQRDDDEDDPYGGVVYKYNDQVVMVYTPNRWDGFSNGSVIYTGGSTWSGPAQMQENRAKVRVRVWSPLDFPCPDYVTPVPLQLQAGPGTQSFVELAHGLGRVPEYVTVQVRHGHSKWFSDGIGYVMTSSMTSINTSWGGVLYGYNASHIRIWTPSTGSLYSSADGWGREYNETQNSGSVIVKMWKFFNGVDLFSKSEVIGSKATSVVKKMAFTSPTFDLDQGLLSVMVKSTVGLNANFHFPATGAVQNAQATGSYGGLIYSYSTSGVKLWQPPSSHGYLVYINNDWGGGAYTQSSNSAQLVVRAWNAYTTCPTTVATYSTMVPPSTTSAAKTTAPPASTVTMTSAGQTTLGLVGQFAKTNANSPLTNNQNGSAVVTGGTTEFRVKGGNSSVSTTAATHEQFQGLSVDLPWWAVGVASGVTLLLVIGSISGVVLCILRAKGKGKDRESRVRTRNKVKVQAKVSSPRVTKQAWDF